MHAPSRRPSPPCAKPPRRARLAQALRVAALFVTVTALSGSTLLADLLLFAVLSWTTTVRADEDSQRATARALATDGFKAMKDQRWADAADRFSRAEALVHAPAHLLYLGRAYSHLGKLVAAHEAYVKLTRETLPSSAPQAAVQAHQDGVKELADLEPRIPTLTISVSPSPPNLLVTMDSAPVSAAILGVSMLVDPGDHPIEAAAEGFVSAQQVAHATEGGHASVSLELRPVASASRTGAASSKAAPKAATAETPRSSEPNDGPSSLKIAGYVTLGAAVLAGAAGAVFAIESHDNRSQGDQLCSGGCSPGNQSQANSLDDQATLFGELAVASFITAGVAAAAGITMIVLPSGKSASSGTALGVWFGPGAAGLRGAF